MFVASAPLISLKVRAPHRPIGGLATRTLPQAARQQRETAMVPSPRLLALTTAVPPFKLGQAEVAQAALHLFDRKISDIERLLPVYENAGIATRYSCVPIDWYLQPHGWVERNRLYVENSVELLTEATRNCLEQAGRTAEEVDAIVIVSTTGIATPSLDALLMDHLPFRRDVRRLPIFGLGCVGGALGLGHAASLVHAAPGSLVLFLVVELCALTFRAGDHGKSNIVASALFGDGAAAVLISDTGDGPEIGSSGSHTWPDSLEVMGWRVKDDGLGVLFSRDIPALVRSELRKAADAFLERCGLRLSDIDLMVCHPGGAKVVDALEDAFTLPAGTMRAARDVLREYGNMSAVTVLFVLQRMLRDNIPGRYLLSALGPGFTAGFQLLEV
jgi:alkylresorcinol/alkylpyrone synthase